MIAFIQAIKKGTFQLDERGFDEIIGVMNLADEIRRQIGVVYDAERNGE